MEKGLKRLTPKRTHCVDQRVDWWASAMRHLAGDRQLSRIIAQCADEGLKKNHDLFRTMLRAVCGQQVSNAAAMRILEALLKEAKRYPGPLPQAVKALGAEGLKRCGLSPTKVKAALSLSDAMLSGEIRRATLSKLTDKEVSERLCALPGVGPWTAQMVLIFGLNRPDVFAHDDYGVKKAGEALFGSVKALEIARVAWHPYGTAATWLLWRSRTKTPVQY